MKLEDVESATLWVEAAGLDPTGELSIGVRSDGPATLRLAGEFGEREVDVPEGESTVTVGPLAPSAGQ